MRSVEIFAGCGGLALGVAKAGFKHELVVERDPLAIETLNQNRKRKIKYLADWTIRAEDVRETDFTTLHSDIHLLSGGPPCQPFSIGGKHEGPDDSRNMWPEAIRAVRQLRPRAFLFENVRGLLRPAFADYLEYLRLQLAWSECQDKKEDSWREKLIRLKARGVAGRKPSYHVLIKGINAADYGAPQKRHRAIIMGVRSDLVDGFEFPQPTNSHARLMWDQWVSGTYWDDHAITNRHRPKMQLSEKSFVEQLRSENAKPKQKAWRTVRDAIGDLPDPCASKESIANHRLHPGARIYERHTGSVWDQPAKALKAGDHGVPGGENILAPGDGSVRYFTLREMARLQGFPDTFKIGEGWKGPIKQLGNAVPVQVGHAFGLEIAKLVG